MYAEGGAVKWPGLPFLATIFHTVGLNVMDPSERNKDILEVSTRALRDMAATSWLRTEPPHFMHGRKFYVHRMRVVVHMEGSLHLHLERVGQQQSHLGYEKQVMMVVFV